MAKYDPLGVLLRQQRGSRVTLSLDEVSTVVQGGLPSSAHRHAAWWSNETGGHHVQARAWMDAGWRAETVDLSKRTVTFGRTSATS